MLSEIAGVWNCVKHLSWRINFNQQQTNNNQPTNPPTQEATPRNLKYFLRLQIWGVLQNSVAEILRYVVDNVDNGDCKVRKSEELLKWMEGSLNENITDMNVCNLQFSLSVPLWSSKVIVSFQKSYWNKNWKEQNLSFETAKPVLAEEKDKGIMLELP